MRSSVPAAGPLPPARHRPPRPCPPACGPGERWADVRCRASTSGRLRACRDSGPAPRGGSGAPEGAGGLPSAGAIAAAPGPGGGLRPAGGARGLSAAPRPPPPDRPRAPAPCRAAAAEWQVARGGGGRCPSVGLSAGKGGGGGVCPPVCPSAGRGAGSVCPWGQGRGRSVRRGQGAARPLVSVAGPGPTLHGEEQPGTARPEAGTAWPERRRRADRSGLSAAPRGPAARLGAGPEGVGPGPGPGPGRRAPR